MPKLPVDGNTSFERAPVGESKADWPFRRAHPAVCVCKKKLPKKVAPKTILIREKLVRAELALVQLHITEVGGNNHGPWVKRFLAETGLPEGYPWCAAMQSYEIHQAAGKKLPIESASVFAMYSYARQHGWLVTRPLRGDLCLFDFDGDKSFDDHVGLVVKVLQLGPALTIRTVEGNTSSGAAGSQTDGGGVYLRTRVLPASRVAFARIPGTVAA